MGIGPGSWVGLMLGNVPDFVILALALSKIDAVVVPLDPTTGNRELEMVLEAAPLRALITRPRGGEGGGQAAAGPPFYANPVAIATAGDRSAEPAVQVRAREPAAPAGDAADLQPLQAQPGRRRWPAATPPWSSSPPPWAAIPRASCARRENLADAAAAIGKTLNIKPTDRVLCTVPAAPQLRLRLRAARQPGARHHAVPRGRDLAQADHQAAARAEHRLLPRATPACSVRWCACRRSNRCASPTRATSARARCCRRRSRRAFKSASGSACCPATTAPRPARWRSIAAARTPRRSASRSRGSSCASRRPSGEKIPAGENGPIWVRSHGLSMLSVPKIHLPKRSDGVPIGGADGDNWYPHRRSRPHRPLGPAHDQRARGRPGQGRRQARWRSARSRAAWRRSPR